MPILYVTATRTVSYAETVTKEIEFSDTDNVEQIVREIREGGGTFFKLFDNAEDVTIVDDRNLSHWNRTGYGSVINNMKIERIKAEIEY